MLIGAREVTKKYAVISLYWTLMASEHFEAMMALEETEVMAQNFMATAFELL